MAIRHQIRNILIITFLILVWIFSLFEVINLSALYGDQTRFDAPNDEPSKLAIETYRLRLFFIIIVIGLPVFITFKRIINIIRTRKQVDK